MKETLFLAIQKYYTIVKSAYQDLYDYININNSVNLKNKTDLYSFLRNCRQSVFDLGEKSYHFHGVGCSVSTNGKQIIAWDFGYRSWLCGIEPYKMALTLSNFSSDLEEIFDAEQISALCKVEVEKGNMTEHYGQYYINLLSLETETYSFPIDYDSLIIEQRNIWRSFCRSKSIDRFIRKSTKVYKNINELEDNLVLIFMRNNTEIGRFLYNDTAYPDSAVRVMDQILSSSNS
ncbi:DUF6896 domain-containing protein [Pseudobutyrivibrio sp.]|jgi:hypothetical protein|uniref:DUF6896 domain-containing protein n=1 Tax=Pseudobutyrivibrio sp. TaxID=2014367 RepID=UPI0025DFD306|nr:hypothetical protein [Pseudobutyrivibrio sp.]